MDFLNVIKVKEYWKHWLIFFLLYKYNGEFGANSFCLENIKCYQNDNGLIIKPLSIKQIFNNLGCTFLPSHYHSIHRSYYTFYFS